MSKNSTAPKRRKVTISVDFDVELDEGIITDLVTLGIDNPEAIQVQSMEQGNKIVGRVTGYTTQQNPE